ncbi:hypothetical protein QQS21_003587 [Conoideocrella luteorostrata]|uniref:Uncharacterized protein n=1 Tax=Conoideocrella luteorostrata TaxID=1105319 RepID=A0AAJ0CVM9_9HYPO|nr:hypothetical protein QQS21_003587 [Conoideocrella luteorostrata]
MYGIKHALIFCLAVTSIAFHHHNDPSISKRGLPAPIGDERIPLKITLGSTDWTRQQISETIKNARDGDMKDFLNRGLKKVKGTWVSKDGPLFEGLGNSKLKEIDLTLDPKNRGKYRAIVTQNKNFVGITEHVESNNVRNLYDVNEKARAGEFLNGGSLPETLKTTNGQSFSREQIAEVMARPGRGDKLGTSGEWAKPIKESIGIRVVYKGNNFIRLEDASNKNAIHPIYTPPPCKRDGTPCEYHILENMDESDNANQPDEIGASPEEGEVAKIPNNNRPGRAGAGEGPEELDVAKIAEDVSEIEFSEFAKAYGLDLVPKEWKMKFSEVRPRLLGYKRLTPDSPKLRAGSGGIAGAKLFGAVGAVAWMNNVIQAFKQDTSALDRGAAITAIIPFVGCAVGHAAGEKNGVNPIINGIDTVLCYLGDGLLLGGFVPAAVVVSFARAVIQGFQPPPELPTQKQMQTARDEPWKDLISEKLFTYIYSHDYFYPRGRSTNFASILESALKIESLAVISQMAQEIGALNASSRIPSLDLDQKQLQISTQNVTKIAREETLIEVIKRQRKILLGFPHNLRDNFTASLKASANEYNSQFTKEITSPETIQKYSISGAALMGILQAQADNFNQKDFYGEKVIGPPTKHMGEISEFLQKEPLPMPSLFEVAFVLGQSKGIKVAPRTLSIQDFLKQKVTQISDTLADAIAITHATSVVRLLQSDIKEDQLPNIYPALNDNIRHELNILISIKLGKLYEDTKVAHSDQLTGQWLSPKALQSLVRPLVPPISTTNSNSTRLVGLLVGLSNTIVEAKLNESSHELPEKQREEVNKKFSTFQTLVNTPQFPETVLKLQFESDAASRAANITKSASSKTVKARDDDPRGGVNLRSRSEPKTKTSEGELLVAALEDAEKQTQRMRNMVAQA